MPKKEERPYLAPRNMTADSVFLCNQIAEWDRAEQRWKVRNPLPILPSIPLDETADWVQISIDLLTFCEQNGLKYDNVAIPNDDKNRLFVYGLRAGKILDKKKAVAA